MTADAAPPVRAARTAVAAAFVLNGLAFASLVARVPDLRARLGLGNAELGLLLLAIAAGSLISLPAAGRMVARWGAAQVVRGGAVACAAGLALVGASVSLAPQVPLVAPGLFVYGLGVGVWDVAMNVEGAEVERGLGRTVMPRFHAGWSIGSIVGAGLAVPVVALGVPVVAHLVVVPVAAAVAVTVAVRRFLPAVVPPPAERAPAPARSAWREPRTLAIGVMVLAFTVAEGAANDWLSLALIDGFDAPHWAGVAGFALFTVAMTTGRLVGPWLLDRHGRAPVLWASASSVAAGTVLLVTGPAATAVPAIVLWGLGAALGFPVGMSAAADDPARAAARVSVVATIGYGAFLTGPPLLGHLGDVVGTLPSLLVVTLLMVPAALTVLVVSRRGATDEAGVRGA